jgi:RNA polymerase sigma-70 factor, ECF subfamily
MTDPSAPRTRLSRAPQAPPGTLPLPLSRERESSLQRRLASRDEQALVELVQICTPWLLGVAQAMLSERDDAEEVVQEAFMIAWRRMDLFDGQGGGLLPWLLRIVRNRSIDRLRARKRRSLKGQRVRAYSLPEEGLSPPAEVDEARLPGWHVHEQVHASLRELPGEQREVVQLVYFEGLTHSEAARRLEIPLGTVKTRLRLAFDKLRPKLASIRDWVL